MSFPKFLKITTIPKIRLLEVNNTLVKKEFQEISEEMLIQLFAEKLGFSYDIVIPDDEEYGTRMPGGNFTGMVGLLQRNEADLLFHRIAITEERMKVIDYSYPYTVDRITFATRNLERTVSPQTFLKPFTFYVWITLALCFCVVPIIYNILFEKLYSFRRLITCRLFREQSEVSKRKYSECILRMFWTIFLLFIRWFYTALVLSFLAFPTLTGVRNIPELAIAVTEGRYQCMASPGSFVTKALRKFGGYSSIIGFNMKKAEETMDFEGALEETGLEKRRAIIASEIDMLHLKEKYFVSDDEFLHVLIIIGISKRFCCKRHLDSVIGYLWPSGIYQHLISKGMHIEEHEIHKESPESEEYVFSERSLSFENFKGVFTLLVCGYVLSFIVLLIEILHSKYC